jgi:hypothetical protein
MRLLVVAASVVCLAVAGLAGCSSWDTRGSVGWPGCAEKLPPRLSDEDLIRAIRWHLGIVGEYRLDETLAAQAEFSAMLDIWEGRNPGTCESFEWHGWVIKRVERGVGLDVGDVIRCVALAGVVVAGGDGSKSWGVCIAVRPTLPAQEDMDSRENVLPR